jgi:histidinol dehydrogenase
MSAAGVEDVVADIIYDVRKNGDEALLRYAKKFDKIDMTAEELIVPEAEIEAAWAQMEPEFRAVLEESAANIAAFHEKQVRNGFAITEKDGDMLEFRYCTKCEGGLEYCRDHLFSHVHVKKGEKPHMIP